jgi:uncharacterized cupin superfamily protein
VSDFTVKSLDDCEAIFDDSFYRVRAGLGVESFGMQVLKFPPGFDQYPNHDHAEEGQEEVYTVLSGAATLLVDGQEHRLEPGVFARVGPDTKRKIVTGDEPVELLCLGATPGRAYEPPQWSKEGAPPPQPPQQ